MSRRLPAVRANEVVRILEKAGFVRWRQKGSHLTMFRQRDQRSLTVPMHFAKTVPKGTLHAIIKAADYPSRNFLNSDRGREEIGSDFIRILDEYISTHYGSNVEVNP